MTSIRSHRSLVALLLALVVFALALAGCDPGGRLAQLTPQPPAATPVVATPSVTAEASPPGAPAPTTAPLPTATYDPTRPAWTVLYYGGADNDRAAFVWDDLNEMEAGAPSDQVQVVAQVDWPEGGPAGTAESVRYHIQADDDPTQLASEVVATLGETNQGDPALLADFISWGVAAYPANRYALVLGDFGGGWVGCCLDAAIGAPEQSDHLSLTDLDQALAYAQGQTNARLEVITFAAGLMGQLDVLQAVQPYAAYAVAAPGLVPGSSWDFQAVLTQLAADPSVDGRQAATDLVTAFVNSQRQLQGNEFVGMAAVDLARVPALSAAVESLATALAADPALYAEVAGFARRGAPTYGAAALTDAERIAAVDLGQAAALIAEASPPGAAQTAATAVSTALGEAVVAYEAGQGQPAGRGIALYWPGGAAALDPGYAAVSRLPSWAAFLPLFTGLTGGNVAHVTLDGGPRQTVHATQPALLRAELFAQRVGAVAVVTEQTEADGRRVLRQIRTLTPATQTLPGGTAATLWADGRHESLFTWDAMGDYLSDATGAGDYVPLRAVDASPIGAQSAVAGLFRRATAARAQEATLVFAPGAARSQLWIAATTDGGARLIGEVLPAPGDVFQPARLISQGDGALTAEPGVSLAYDDTPALTLSARPLPDGDYAVGLRVAALDGAPLAATQPLTVDPAQATAGFRATVDAANGAQFLYPADWLPPTTQDNVTFTRNISGTAQLQVRAYPGWSGDLAALQNEVLSTFGQVSVLQQGPASVGPAEAAVEAIRTAYGYDSPEQGARTGAFITFLKDGVGFVVDLDGPRAEEATTVATLDTIAATWQFLPPRLGFGPEPWSTLNVGEFRLRYPAAFTYEEYNTWQRFAADSQTFVAVRVQPAARTPAEAMSGLLGTAAEGVTGFTADEPQRFFYAGRVWERNDFSYSDANGNPVRGLLLSRQDGETEIAVWAEAPDSAADLTATVFLPVAASIDRIVAPSG